MKIRFYALAVALFLFSQTGCDRTEKNETVSEPVLSSYYFIRHAEKDRSDKSNRNPDLTEEGHERALKWSQVFGDISFDAVYSTDYNRTKQTAQPTASSSGLEITLYDPRNLDGPAFLEANKGKTVLVVGHSNTTPAFVNAVISEKKYADIDDSNNANLYVVTVVNDVVHSRLLKID